MLIRDVEIGLARPADVRIDAGRVVEINSRLTPRTDEALIDGCGGALLPGLHDHHIHLVSVAASLVSVPCGPPQTNSAEALAERLLDHAANEPTADGWLRGIGYHASVAGPIDREWLDRVLPDRPARIQHRSGRLWILNSCALERLTAVPAPLGHDPLEKVNGRPTGRIYDGDAWLRARLPSRLRPLEDVSTLLAGFGVTGVTDATPHNDHAHYRHFAMERERGALYQNLTVMGDASLDRAVPADGLVRGATKIYLRESALPALETTHDAIMNSHVAGRPVAIHCVTVAELVFALSALQDAGPLPGDRIEHASLAPPETIALIRDLGVTVVTQPGFVRERGDAYLSEVSARDVPWLYRLRGFLDAGIPLGGSTDAPYSDPSPWLAMDAAVRRVTAAGNELGADEALPPEAALGLFTGPPEAPGSARFEIAEGDRANLCLIDRPWRKARQDLTAVRVAATLIDGRVVFPVEFA